MRGRGAHRAMMSAVWLDVAVAVLAIVAFLAVVAVILGWRITGQRDPPDADTQGSLVGQTVPSAPAGMPGIGMYVLSEVQSSGEVRVSHWIRTETPIDHLDLLTADPDQLLGTVEALGVVVSAADAEVLARRDSVGTTQERVDLRRPVAELYLTYVVPQELDDATGSVPGRTLARVTAMDVAYDGESGPVLRVIRSPGTVLNVACQSPDAAGSTPPRPCGHATGDGGWEVLLWGDRRDDRLLAQLQAG